MYAHESDVQAGFRKGRGTRDQIANICWIVEKAREFKKKICFINYAKVFDCVDHNRLWKILKRWEYQTALPVSSEDSMHERKQQLEPDMDQRTDSKSGKEYLKAVHCHPAYLTSMQSASCKMLGWMTHRLESRLPINNLRYANYTTLMAESKEGPKEPLHKGESEKVGLKLNIQSAKIMASGPISSWQINGEKRKQ